MLSIQARLATGLIVSLVLLLLVQWVMVQRSIQSLSENYIVAKLMHASDLLVAAVAINGSLVTFDESRIDPVYRKPFSGYYYTIKFTNKEVRSRSLWDESLPLPELKPGASKTGKVTGPQGQHLLIVSNGYRKKNIDISIAVAENISTIKQEIASLSRLHALVSLFILFALVFLQIVIIRKSLAPLDKTRNELDLLESGQIQALDENVPREISSLVKEINLRIRAFQQRLERSRRASGNLAHALKRPLTLIDQVSQSESLPHDVQRELQLYTQEIKKIIDRELAMARMAGTSIGGQILDVKLEADALIKSLQAMYAERSLNIDLVGGEACKLRFDREDFHELLGNLLDNACKWAKSTVKVRLNCDDGISVVVEDDGPGIDPSLRQKILQRGTKLDEQMDGHGLGMSIVKDILDQYQAKFDFSHSESLGGLKVEISFGRQIS